MLFKYFSSYSIKKIFYEEWMIYYFKKKKNMKEWYAKQTIILNRNEKYFKDKIYRMWMFLKILCGGAEGSTGVGKFIQEQHYPLRPAVTRIRQRTIIS